ncbi:RNA polymerase sigma factor [Paenibacillus sp. TY11]|uniref:RNA polymerase sigma factor n=1 Tax=Paenibacillus sp. TY11 TaxID=3448633 RepID=UPI004039A5F9
MPEQQQWMERCRNGDREAFYRLMEPMLHRAYSTSAAILGSTDLAEDAVQNAMIEAYQAIINGKEIRNFASWFKQLTAMRFLDLARKQSRMRRFSGDLNEIDPVDEKAQPVDALLKKEQDSCLLRQVMSLDMRYRTVIVLYYYQEMSVEEISRILGVKKGTVKSRLHHARAKLLKIRQNNGKVICDV